MKQLPKSMVVIGGGVIGSEYACLFNALGVKTTLVHPKARAWIPCSTLRSARNS